MIYELAEIDVKDGHEAAFAEAVDEASQYFLGTKGCRSLRLTRSMEHPHRFRIVVEWETLDDHMVGFRNSDAFTEWRRLAGPHFASPPRVEHLEVLLKR